ncbi:hypothetical protein HMPREF0083_00317 [Aneurinibacillus aneurinilyticus ATCC 12856]|uniref:Uncharacterized protein n=1 Tax=Aneurinibacillus aneurinilyticus ATCC 12856 TaxID=649747 RepID=U1YL97_ANEAE|nr:hypothetical protein HMPREF0083_00317 [Aneurinibacillus aneurinilyticus ATCC 12856]
MTKDSCIINFFPEKQNAYSIPLLFWFYILSRVLIFQFPFA